MREMISAFAYSALNHNANLIKKAEKTLSEMAECKNTYIWFENPDGTRVQVQPGCKLTFVQYCSAADKEL